MVTIMLPAQCDRAAAEKLLPEFLAAMGDGPLGIDATGVTRLGQAVLQLLVSARRTGKGAQITPSPALVDAARLTGLVDVLFDGDEV